MNNLMNFEGNNVEIFEWNGQVLFNPRHVAYILNIKNVNDNLRKMSNKQVVKLKNSDIGNTDIRKLNNAGENFLTESGVYKLIFKSRQPAAERFSDWVADDVLPRIRKTGSYEMPEKEKNKKEKLSSVNQMAKNITGLLQEAGVDAKFIAAEVVRIYTDNGYPVHSPVITEDSKLWDCTSIAKELEILSTNGNPEDKGYQVKYPDGYESWSPAGVFEAAYREYDKNKLPATAVDMMSEDYKERFKAEYKQLEIRFDGLRKMLKKWDEGTLAFEPTCPRSTHNMQLKAMADYMAVLEARAVMENVDLLMV